MPRMESKALKLKNPVLNLSKLGISPQTALQSSMIFLKPKPPKTNNKTKPRI